MHERSANASPSGTSQCIGNVALGEIPRVVLGVCGDDPRLASAVDAGVDIFEFRVDRLASHRAVDVVAAVKHLKRYGLPIIGTVRSPTEGGKGDLPASQRLALHVAISPHVDAIDVELSSTDLVHPCVEAARHNGNTVIMSFHDFTETPSTEHLSEIAERAIESGAHIIKIATQARDHRDVARLFRFTDDHRDRHLITIAMGAVGSISRLTFPLAGSLMTYTSLPPSHGQVPLDVLVDHLRLYYPAYNQELVNRCQLLQYA